MTPRSRSNENADRRGPAQDSTLPIAAMIELEWHISHLVPALMLAGLVAAVVRLQDGRQHDKRSTKSKVAAVTSASPTRTDRSPTANLMETSAPFDSLATSYDKSFCETTVGCMLRRETWKVLEEAFASSQVPPPSSDGNNNNNSNNDIIIELSCGTGEDAMWLAAKHVHILATDYSDGMIDVARSKCRSCSAIAKEDQPIFCGWMSRALILLLWILGPPTVNLPAHFPILVD